MHVCNVSYELPSLLLPFSLLPSRLFSTLPSSLLLFTESEELLSQVRSARIYHIAISPDLIHLVATTQDNHLLLVNLPDYFQVRTVGKGGREREGGREEGREKGREEGREGGREGGREECRLV